MGSRFVFAKRRANRMKVLMHDSIGIYLSARGCIKAASSGPTLPWSAQMVLSR